MKPRKRACVLLVALVLASAVCTPEATLAVTAPATTPATTPAAVAPTSSVCAAPKCKLSSGGTCDRSIAGCPVCLQFVAATNTYSCTTVSKTTNACPDGFVLCASAATTPAPSATPTPTPTNVLASVKIGSNATSDDVSKLSGSGKLTASSVETPAPQTAVSTKTTSSSSSFPTWIVIGAATVVGCVLAAVLGTMYASRQNRRQPREDESESVPGLGGAKDFDDSTRGPRATTITEFTDSVVDFTTTPATSTSFAYAPAASTRSTQSAADSAVFLKSDSMWRQTTTSHHSFRGSQHVNMSYIDDPLTASQLTATDLAHSYSAARESDDAFRGPSHSEWASVSYFGTGSRGPNDDDDAMSTASGNTEFYSSKISAISIADDDDVDDDDGTSSRRQFAHRSSERLTDDNAAKWKQKFYVEL